MSKVTKKYESLLDFAFLKVYPAKFYQVSDYRLSRASSFYIYLINYRQFLVIIGKSTNVCMMNLPTGSGKGIQLCCCDLMFYYDILNRITQTYILVSGVLQYFVLLSISSVIPCNPWLPLYLVLYVSHLCSISIFFIVTIITVINNKQLLYNTGINYPNSRGGRCHVRIEVGFTTTYAIGAYHH